MSKNNKVTLLSDRRSGAKLISVTLGCGGRSTTEFR
jgi:hypothetical protein